GRANGLRAAGGGQEPRPPRAGAARAPANRPRGGNWPPPPPQRGPPPGANRARLLRLDAGCLVEPLEPPDLQITLIDPDKPLCDLLPLALTNRPELAANQALVQASLDELRQERLRPFLPILVVRGASTNPAGTLAMG